MSLTQLTPFEESLRTPASPEHLQQITAFVRQAAARVGFDAVQLNRIELAVDEASSNIIQHAYAERSDGDIEVQVRGEPGHRIVIQLIDEGAPFDPNSVPAYDPQRPLDEMWAGGFGLYLMQRIMDELSFEFDVASGDASGRHVNRLTMVKYL